MQLAMVFCRIVCLLVPVMQLLEKFNRDEENLLVFCIHVLMFSLIFFLVAYAISLGVLVYQGENYGNAFAVDFNARSGGIQAWAHRESSMYFW